MDWPLLPGMLTSHSYSQDALPQDTLHIMSSYSFAKDTQPRTPELEFPLPCWSLWSFDYKCGTHNCCNFFSAQ